MRKDREAGDVPDVRQGIDAEIFANSVEALQGYLSVALAVKEFHQKFVADALFPERIPLVNGDLYAVCGGAFPERLHPSVGGKILELGPVLVEGASAKAKL